MDSRWTDVMDREEEGGKEVRGCWVHERCTVGEDQIAGPEQIKVKAQDG